MRVAGGIKVQAEITWCVNDLLIHLLNGASCILKIIICTIIQQQPLQVKFWTLKLKPKSNNSNHKPLAESFWTPCSRRKALRRCMFGAFHLLMFAETACENDTTMQQVGMCPHAHLILHLLETSGDFLLPFVHFWPHLDRWATACPS